MEHLLISIPKLVVFQAVVDLLDSAGKRTGYEIPARHSRNVYPTFGGLESMADSSYSQ